MYLDLHLPKGVFARTRTFYNLNAYKINDRTSLSLFINRFIYFCSKPQHESGYERESEGSLPAAWM